MTLVFTLGFLKDIKKNAEMMSLNCNSLYIFCRKMLINKKQLCSLDLLSTAFLVVRALVWHTLLLYQSCNFTNRHANP